MTAPAGDKRPRQVVAMEWVSQVTTVGVLMALPAGVGYWGDQKLGTSPWLVIVGAGFGMLAGMWQVLRITGGSRRTTKK